MKFTQRHLVALVAALALLGSATAPASAQVAVGATVQFNSLFSPIPNAAVVGFSRLPLNGFAASQTSMGALNVALQPQDVHFTSMVTLPSGILLTLHGGFDITAIGPGALAAGFQPGGTPQPATLNPPEFFPGTDPPITPAIFHAGYKSAGGPHFGGTLALVGQSESGLLAQTSPGFLIRQQATRPLLVGHATATSQMHVTPHTLILTPMGTNLITDIPGSESRYEFPWTTGSISAVGLLGTLAPYGGAGALGTPMQVTAPRNLRTVAGFDGRALNTALGTLTGDLQLVAPGLVLSNPATTPTNTSVWFWEMNMKVVPEPGAVAMLATGLGTVSLLAYRRSRIA